MSLNAEEMERVCELVLNAQDQETRVQSEQFVFSLCNTPENWSIFEELLFSSQSVYVQIVACHCMRKLLCLKHGNVSIETLKQFQSRTFEQISNNSVPNQFLIPHLSKLMVLIIRTIWKFSNMESDNMRSFFDSSVSMARISSSHLHLSLKFIHRLVCDCRMMDGINIESKYLLRVFTALLKSDMMFDFVQLCCYLILVSSLDDNASIHDVIPSEISSFNIRRELISQGALVIAFEILISCIDFEYNNVSFFNPSVHDEDDEDHWKSNPPCHIKKYIMDMNIIKGAFCFAVGSCEFKLSVVALKFLTRVMTIRKNNLGDSERKQYVSIVLDGMVLIFQSCCTSEKIGNSEYSIALCRLTFFVEEYLHTLKLFDSERFRSFFESVLEYTKFMLLSALLGNQFDSQTAINYVSEICPKFTQCTSLLYDESAFYICLYNLLLFWKSSSGNIAYLSDDNQAYIRSLLWSLTQIYIRFSLDSWSSMAKEITSTYASLRSSDGSLNDSRNHQSKLTASYLVNFDRDDRIKKSCSVLNYWSHFNILLSSTGEKMMKCCSTLFKVNYRHLIQFLMAQLNEIFQNYNKLQTILTSVNDLTQETCYELSYCLYRLSWLIHMSSMCLIPDETTYASYFSDGNQIDTLFYFISSMCGISVKVNSNARLMEITKTISVSYLYEFWQTSLIEFYTLLFRYIGSQSKRRHGDENYAHENTSESPESSTGGLLNMVVSSLEGICISNQMNPGKTSLSSSSQQSNVNMISDQVIEELSKHHSVSTQEDILFDWFLLISLQTLRTNDLSCPALLLSCCDFLKAMISDYKHVSVIRQNGSLWRFIYFHSANELPILNSDLFYSSINMESQNSFDPDFYQPVRDSDTKVVRDIFSSLIQIMYVETSTYWSFNQFMACFIDEQLCLFCNYLLLVSSCSPGGISGMMSKDPNCFLVSGAQANVSQYQRAMLHRSVIGVSYAILGIISSLTYDSGMTKFYKWILSPLSKKPIFGSQLIGHAPRFECPSAFQSLERIDIFLQIFFIVSPQITNQHSRGVNASGPFLLQDNLESQCYITLLKLFSSLIPSYADESYAVLSVAEKVRFLEKMAPVVTLIGHNLISRFNYMPNSDLFHNIHEQETGSSSSSNPKNQNLGVHDVSHFKRFFGLVYRLLRKEFLHFDYCLILGVSCCGNLLQQLISLISNSRLIEFCLPVPQVAKALSAVVFCLTDSYLDAIFNFSDENLVTLLDLHVKLIQSSMELSKADFSYSMDRVCMYLLEKFVETNPGYSQVDVEYMNSLIQRPPMTTKLSSVLGLNDGLNQPITSSLILSVMKGKSSGCKSPNWYTSRFTTISVEDTASSEQIESTFPSFPETSLLFQLPKMWQDSIRDIFSRVLSLFFSDESGEYKEICFVIICLMFILGEESKPYFISLIQKNTQPNSTQHEKSANLLQNIFKRIPTILIHGNPYRQKIVDQMVIFKTLLLSSSNENETSRHVYHHIPMGMTSYRPIVISFI